MQPLAALGLLLVPLFFDVSPTPQGPRHPWTSFKIGSWAKLSYTTKMGGGGENKMSYTMTLIEITKEKFKLEYDMNTNGVSTKNVVEQAVGQDPYKTLTKGATGVETLTIAGKRLRCTWTVYEMKQDQLNGTYKIWTCPSVPGHMVRMEGKYDTGGMNVEYSGQVEEYNVK
jgi:hypothetical protein